VADWPGAAELVSSPTQVVSGNWERALTVDTAPLRDATIKHADQFTWSALEERWIRWVERLV
jgi:hypothetical protein